MCPHRRDFQLNYLIASCLHILFFKTYVIPTFAMNHEKSAYKNFPISNGEMLSSQNGARLACPLGRVLELVDETTDRDKLNTQETVVNLMELLNIKGEFDPNKVQMIFPFLRATEPKEVARFVLTPWIRKHKDDATLHLLCTAFKQVKMRALADSIAQEFSAPLSKWMVTSHTVTKLRSFSCSDAGKPLASGTEFTDRIVYSSETDSVTSFIQGQNLWKRNCSRLSPEKKGEDFLGWENMPSCEGSQPEKDSGKSHMQINYKRYAFLGFGLALGCLGGINIASTCFLTGNMSGAITNMKEWISDYFAVEPRPNSNSRDAANSQFFGPRIYVFGNGLQLDSVQHLLDRTSISSITWNGSIELSSLTKTLSLTKNLDSLSLTYRPSPFIAVEGKKYSTLQKDSLLNSEPKIKLASLKELHLSNFSATNLKSFLNSIDIEQLEIFRLENSIMYSDTEQVIAKLIIKNRFSLRRIQLSGTTWKSWIFNTEFPEFPLVNEIFVPMNVRGSLSKYGIRKDFCKTFPNIEIFSAEHGSMSRSDMKKLLDCKGLTHLTVNLSVPRELSTISLDFLHEAPPSLKKLKLMVDFEVKYENGHCYLDEIPRGTFKFMLILRTNCS